MDGQRQLFLPTSDNENSPPRKGGRKSTPRAGAAASVPGQLRGLGHAPSVPARCDRLRANTPWQRMGMNPSLGIPQTAIFASWREDFPAACIMEPELGTARILPRQDQGQGRPRVVSHKSLVLGCSNNAPGQGVRTEPTRSGLRRRNHEAPGPSWSNPKGRGSFRVPRRGSLLTDLCGSARPSRLVGHENPSRRNTSHL